MSMGLGHFSAGAAIALIIFRVVDYYSKRITMRQYLRYDLVVVILGGLWAMIPDFPSVLGNFEELVTGPLCNTFFFHCFLDSLDPNDSILFSAFLFGIFLVDSLFITWFVTHKKQIDRWKHSIK